MKTTQAEREAWRAEATLRYSDGMAVRVLDDLAACEARCAALQAENDAHANWLNEEWPTTEDMVLGELVRERDEAIAKVVALTAMVAQAMSVGLAECERLRTALLAACAHLDMAVEASEESGDLDEEEAREERVFIKGLRRLSAEK